MVRADPFDVFCVVVIAATAVFAHQLRMPVFCGPVRLRFRGLREVGMREIDWISVYAVWSFAANYGLPVAVP